MASSDFSSVKTASIEWRDNAPFCTEFNDVYYHSEQPFKENGLKETEYIFITQNQLPKRWQSLDNHSPKHKTFTIGETGFGTGLNFLTACDLWLKTAPSNWRLKFISTEIRPISADDLKAIHTSWSVFSELSKELLAQYPPLTPGVHLIELAQGRIQLILMLGEANQMLKSIAQSPDSELAIHQKKSIDAWFLDGFAPTKNPELWCDEIFDSIASLSAENTTFATFTCASAVRKGLINAGFNCEKVKGFGKKRESLRGEFKTRVSSKKKSVTHWFLDQQPKQSDHESVIVLGAGIAGCTAANTLAKRGYRVTVIDRHQTVANEGSGNLQAVVYPKLSRQNDALPRINLSAMTLASRFYKPYWEQGLGSQCGVLLLPDSEQSRSNLEQIAKRFTQHTKLVTPVNNQQIRDLSGLSLEAQQGLFFPQLGWLPPQTLCQKLLEEQNIPLMGADIKQIDQCASSQQWQVIDHSTNAIASADILILATAYECQQFSQTEFLTMNQLRGQVTHLSQQQAASDLKTVICGKGYIAPVTNGVQSCGASYNKGIISKETRIEDHSANLQMMQNTDSGLAEAIHCSAPDSLEGRANYRATTNDYLPIVGAVPNAELFKQQYDALRRDATTTVDSLGSYFPNLYIHCGLGSRGLSYAPLTAEILAAEINGELSPLERDLRLAMHPARFLIRDLKRRKI
ncbi:MAG: bifunctional tRNA (5-methylaminomethyl-2-thiouridine)(34)-methyltransferase MnmD/FAD-dependent 5-carboxymethylaminomethyl-2-thiouridine(34) oxidoreductase MnmC [Porticoccaceae bacterium]